MDVNERIETAGELFEVLKKTREIVIYGAGYVAQEVVKCCKVLNKGYNIRCIAVRQLEGNVADIMNLTVFPISTLRLYYDTGLFLVATDEKLHKQILSELKDRGCKNIKLLSNYAFKELKSMVSDSALQRYLVEETFKIARINQKKIEQQNEICYVNTKSFAKYKNCNREKEVVVVGTGPTFVKYKPIDGAVHIGVNGACIRKDIKFDYYFMADFDRRYDNNNSYIKDASGQIFVGRYMQEFASKYIESPMDCELLDRNVKRYFSDSFMVMDIYPDICFHPLANFGSIIFNALHFALYTYPKKIYLVGCDVEFTGHFYDSIEKNNPADNMRDEMIWFRLGYSKMKHFADYFYPDTEIISINPRGLKGLFKDI
jgi:hypothetical protein